MSSQSSISSELSLGSNAVPAEEADEADEEADDDDDAPPPALPPLLLLPFPLPAAATGDEGACIRLAAAVPLARGFTAGFASIVARPWSAEPAGFYW